MGRMSLQLSELGAEEFVGGCVVQLEAVVAVSNLRHVGVPHVHEAVLEAQLVALAVVVVGVVVLLEYGVIDALLAKQDLLLICEIVRDVLGLVALGIYFIEVFNFHALQSGSVGLVVLQNQRNQFFAHALAVLHVSVGVLGRVLCSGH